VFSFLEKIAHFFRCVHFGAPGGKVTFTTRVYTDGEHSDVLDVLRELRSAQDKSLPDSWSVRRNEHAAVPLMRSVPWNRGLNVYLSMSILFCRRHRSC